MGILSRNKTYYFVEMVPLKRVAVNQGSLMVPLYEEAKIQRGSFIEKEIDKEVEFLKGHVVGMGIHKRQIKLPSSWDN